MQLDGGTSNGKELELPFFLLKRIDHMDFCILIITKDNISLPHHFSLKKIRKVYSRIDN